MLVGPHGADLPHFPSTAVFGGFPLIRRPNRCDDGRPGADSVPEAARNFAPPETSPPARLRLPTSTAFSPPKAFDAAPAGAEKLSPSSTPAPNEDPDLRDAHPPTEIWRCDDGMSVGADSVHRGCGNFAPPETGIYGLFLRPKRFPLIRRPNRCDDGRPGADSVPEAARNLRRPSVCWSASTAFLDRPQSTAVFGGFPLIRRPNR